MSYELVVLIVAVSIKATLSLTFNSFILTCAVFIEFSLFSFVTFFSSPVFCLDEFFMLIGWQNIYQHEMEKHLSAYLTRNPIAKPERRLHNLLRRR